MKQRSIPNGHSHVNGSIVKWWNKKNLPRLRITTAHDGINKALHFIARHFATPIQVPDLAIIAGLSRRGFHKAFEKHVGAKPGRALRAIRLDYAKHLLRKEDLKLIRVARQSGFISTNSFCVAFRRDIGISPKRFQRQQPLPFQSAGQGPQSRRTVSPRRVQQQA